MTQRKTKIELIPESALDEADRPVMFGYMIRSRSLVVRGDKLLIKHKYSGNGLEHAAIDFANALLPPNLLHPRVSTLIERPDIAKIVVAAIDGYMLSHRSTKSTANAAKAMGLSIIKFLEYLWLRDIYRLCDVADAVWAEFLNEYAEGGWYTALQLQRRASSIDLQSLSLKRRVSSDRTEYGSQPLLSAMGTNVKPMGLRLEAERGSKFGNLVLARKSRAMTESSIVHIVQELNNLAGLPKEIRAPSLAHRNPYLLAASLAARSPERTRNFEPKELAALLKESFRWVSEYAPLIIQLAEDTYSPLTSAEAAEADEARLVLMIESPSRRLLAEAIGVPIRSVRRMGDWESGLGLLGVLRILLAACFLLIGVFNARRKDEIQSRTIGLYADSFKCLDDGFGIYECQFYCEKTALDYKPFYVNEVTYKCLSVLRRMSDISWRQAVLNGGQNQDGERRKLFCIPPIQGSRLPVWYDYSSDAGVDLLLARATGKQLSSDIQI